MLGIRHFEEVRLFKHYGWIWIERKERHYEATMIGGSLNGLYDASIAL